VSPFGELRHEQRGAQLLSWYMTQWGGGLNIDDASVMLVTDVLAYSRTEGESPPDICDAAQASLTFHNHEEGGS
jgi:hypothetical protein